MSDVRVFKVENRLAKVIRLPGGRTVAEALRGADTRVASIRDRCLVSLAAKGVQLHRLAEQAKSGADPASLSEVYATANEIFSIAGAFGMREAAEAAYSLCDLVDDSSEREAVNWPAVDVHVDGVRFLCSEAGAEHTPIRAAIVEGLRAVAARCGEG
jgi:hypothetical protein